MQRESESEENVSWNEIGEVLDMEMSTVEDIRADLARNEKGNICQTINNCMLVFQRDPLLKGAIRKNELSGKIDIVGNLGWQRTSSSLTDTDVYQIHWYLEKNYGLKNDRNINKAMNIVASENKYHPIRECLEKLKWDGQPRIDNLLPKEAVRKFNYTFANGVYGLLGENGAGKTTLMRLICGILQPTGGSIYCDNIEIASMGAEYRRLLGYLPQDFGYYGDFTAERFLRYMAALKALSEDYADSRIDELLDMVELKNVKKKKLKTFSGGMIRRIGIAQALLNNPEILILDEPTAGLDPKERVRFRNVISSLGKNRMVLLSTHIVSDIDYIADRILIMKNGELIQEGTEKEITDKVEGCVWKCIVSEKEAVQITSSFIVSNMRSSGENVELRIVSERQPVAGAESVESILEDAYLYHTQITGGEKNATL